MKNQLLASRAQVPQLCSCQVQFAHPENSLCSSLLPYRSTISTSFHPCLPVQCSLVQQRFFIL